MMAHKRALLSSKGISAFGLGGYPDLDEVYLIPTVAGQRRTFTILLGSMITGFPLAAFASGLKATYAEYLVDMLEYSPGTTYGSRKKTTDTWRSPVSPSGNYLFVILAVPQNCRSGKRRVGHPPDPFHLYKHHVKYLLKAPLLGGERWVGVRVITVSISGSHFSGGGITQVNPLFLHLLSIIFNEFP